MTDQDPLNVLRRFPTTMNWRGIFDITSQYIRNDVVTSPINGVTYICITVSALLGADPFTNPTDWFIFTGSISAIHTVNLGAGLSNIGTPTSLIIENIGVQTIDAGNGIFLTGTPQNRVVNSIAVTNLIAGLGISVNGGEITNNGIRTLSTGGGLYLETPPPDAKISQNNILSLTDGDGILNTGTAQNPVLENDWVRTATFTNITNTGTANDLILSIVGVDTISNNDGSLQIIPNFFYGPRNIEIGCIESPISIQIAAPSSTVPTGWPAGVNIGAGFINFTCISPLLNASLANGADAVITVNLSSICFRVTGTGPTFAQKGVITAVDSTTSSSLIISNVQTGFASLTTYPFDTSFGTVDLDITLLRAAGLRVLTGFRFQPIFQQTWYLLSYGPIYGVWTQS